MRERTKQERAERGGMHSRWVSRLRSPVDIACIAMTCAWGSSAVAADLFTITATAPGTQSVTLGADRLLDLVDDAVNTRGAFSPFQSLDSTFSLNYGGIEDAIIVTKNAGNTQAQLTFGHTGVSRTFTGTNQDDLENQIEEYLKKGAGQDVTDFLKEVNARSVIAVSDGNPNATTARMAQFTYDRFGFFGDQFKAYRLERVQPALDGGEPAPAQGDDGAAAEASAHQDGTQVVERRAAGVQFFVMASGATFEAGDFDGESATIASSLDFNLSKRVGVSVGTMLAYNTIGDADIFHGSVVLGVPIRVVLPDDASRWTWQLTPHATIGGSGSEDLGAGGLIYGLGATSALAWHLDDRWTLALANHLSFYEGEKLEFDEFEIDPGVSQSITKHGLRATYRFSDQWYGYAGATYSAFLEDAAIDSWISPAAGLGYSSLAGSGVQAGLFADVGDDYEAIGVRLAASFAF